MIRKLKNKRVAKLYSRLPSKALFIIYLAIYSSLIIAGLSSQLDFSGNPHGTTILLVISIFDLFILELIVVSLLGVWLINDNRYMRIIAYLFATLFIVINGIQLASFYQGKEFISKLAIENLNHLSLIINTKNLLSVACLLALCFVLVLIVEKQPQKSGGKLNTIIIISIVFLGFALLFQNSKHWLPNNTLKQREAFLFKNYMIHTSPIVDLYETISAEKSTISSGFSPSELIEIGKYGFHLNVEKQYPLIKDTIYSENAPFELIEGKTAKPNIIVFFSEGISARTLSMYSDTLYPDLTPNLENFSKKSMIVDNYYNHTAATYRGLLGQLCSLFPTHGGAVKEARYLSLNNIFENNLYDTIFLDAHRKDKARVYNLMKRIGFDNVLTGEPLSQKYLNGEKLKGGESLSDYQFLESFVGFLKEKEKTKTSQNPFFLCLYNLGTHAFLPLSSDGKKYKKTDNISLNTIHNFDNAFGNFWKYYQNSPYKEDTIIVFTADHSHYPEKPFIEAFKQPGYQPYFIDRIPLIIHDPTRNLPKSFNANYSTSVDFAPSLLHYLQFPNHQNPFMGSSIFTKKSRKVIKHGIAQFGDGVYFIKNDRVFRSTHSKGYEERLALIWKFIKYSQHLEVTGKLWDVNTVLVGAHVKESR